MSDVNVVALTGRLTRDPEAKATPSGTSVLGFGIAVKESRKNKAGQWEDYPNFIDCVLFGKRADALSRMLSKGMQVSVSGHLRQESWQDKDGHRRSRVSVIAEEVVLPPRDAQRPAQQPVTGVPESAPDPYADEIPF